MISEYIFSGWISLMGLLGELYGIEVSTVSSRILGDSYLVVYNVCFCPVTLLDIMKLLEMWLLIYNVCLDTSSYPDQVDITNSLVGTSMAKIKTISFWAISGLEVTDY